MSRIAGALLGALLLTVSPASYAGAQDAPPSPVPDTDAVAPITLDARVADIVDLVNAGNLRDTDRRLVGFGTRNVYSEKLDSKTRGVYAARDYLVGRFTDISKVADGRMSVDVDTFTQPKSDRMPRAVEVASVYATLKGDDPEAATYVMSSHYDSRNSNGNDETLDSPGADDNGSGTSAVLEAARVMVNEHFQGTIIFACFDGEEQGLFGSAHFARLLANRGIRVGADLNNDIIGSSEGHDGLRFPNDVRLFSEALPVNADVRRVNLIGTENDSPSRELARFVKETAEAYVPRMHVNHIFRSDRFLRGGDQQSFAENGFAAVRFVEASENFDHQHQTIRNEAGVQYGDLLKYMDFDYLARVTKLNVAALATLALAPAPPVVKMDAKELGYDTKLSWNAVPGATSYEILWRRTYEPNWTHERSVTGTSVTMNMSKDDWLFGVRSVSAEGDRSVAAFPTPISR